MENDFKVEDLADAVEEEFGNGYEIASTGFLILGLLTFWIYTVHRFYRLLSDHINQRLNYFDNLLDSDGLSRNNKKDYHLLADRGFKIKPFSTFICIVLYGASMLLIVSIVLGMQLASIGYIRMETLDATSPILIGAAAFLFCLSSIFFLLWVSRSIKNHEYYELLMFKFAKAPEQFKKVRPSEKFVKRWNRNQNWVAFFLILSVPMTVSPFVAIEHIQRVIYGGGDYVSVIVIWSLLLLAVTTVFHFWGTKLLISMFNGHVRIETVNRQSMEAVTPWSSDKSASVLAQVSEGAASLSQGTLVPERTLAAILLTDMVGFSKKMENREEDTYSKLLIHNEIIRKHIRTHNGVEIKTIGDAFLVRYVSAVDAVRSAMEMQNEFATFNHNKNEDEKMLVRIGIHIGDILMMDGDVFGNGVNIASRIEPLAEPGGICISADMYNLVKKSIDIKVLSLGKQELKNIREAPEIFKIIGRSVK